MEQAFGSLVPIAVAAALSSMPIMVTVLILLSHNRNRSALPFLLGWVLGAFVLVSVGTIAASSAPRPRPGHADTTAGLLELLLGAALVALSLRALLTGGGSASGQSSRLAGAVGAVGAVKAFGLGLVLNIRPKGLILSAAASLALRSAKLNVQDTAVLVVAYCVIATSTVTTPILATLVAPDRMEPGLIRARDWLGEHGYVVTSTIMLPIGVIVFGSGLGKL
jgi:hypothetical protein